MAKKSFTAGTPAEETLKGVSTKSKVTLKKNDSKPVIYKLGGRFETESRTCNTTRTHAHQPLFFALNGESITRVYNKDTEEYEERSIRYARGVRSIFADEQPKTAKAEPIMFEQGFIFAYPSEVNKKAFLDACSENVSNPNRIDSVAGLFYRVDVEKEAKQRSTGEINRAAVVYFIKVNWKDEYGQAMLKAFATTVGIDVDRLEGFEVRDALIQMAVQNPEGFATSLKSQAHNRKYYILKALSGNIIGKDAGSNAIHWANPNGTLGGQILSCPVGADAVDFMVSWTFDAGDKTYQVIRQKVDDAELHSFIPAEQEEAKAYLSGLEELINGFED